MTGSGYVGRFGVNVDVIEQADGKRAQMTIGFEVHTPGPVYSRDVYLNYREAETALAEAPAGSDIRPVRVWVRA